MFPLTGYPPTDVDSWKRIIGIAKSYGLNLIRFHSWCPPEAAFTAADELGFISKAPRPARGRTKANDAWRRASRWTRGSMLETERILKAYGNHPSFVLMTYGNEPGGKNFNAFLAGYVRHFKSLDPRRLWSSSSSYSQLPENQFHVASAPRIQAWGAGLKSRINALPPETMTDYGDYIAKRHVPVISHEIGQWSTAHIPLRIFCRDQKIQRSFEAGEPGDFPRFTRGLHSMADQERGNFCSASGENCRRCVTRKILNRRCARRAWADLNCLASMIFPAKGTAPVGVLDAFWDSKGYIGASNFTRFCSAVVPLAQGPSASSRRMKR